MTIVTRAVRFLQRLVRRPRRPACPHCGSTLWQKHGFYRRGQRCLDRLRLHAPIQRYRCLSCGRTFSRPPPWVVPHKWYGRDVIRKALDLYVRSQTSWREVASVLLGEVTGRGRGQVWAPWRRGRRGGKRVKLAHTTAWRWLQAAGQRALEPEHVAGRYGGLFGGILATDETALWLRVGKQKVAQGLQALVDGASRVVLRLGRLVGESEEAVRTGVEELVRRGVPLETIQAWLSDGLPTYAAVLAMLNLGGVGRQRSIFHLWRNLAGVLRAYEAAKGKELAAALRAAVHRVWDAPSERLAVVALWQLWVVYGDIAVAQEVVGVVQTTFREATFHLKGMVPGLPRTSGVVEWLWRRYKRRQRLLQCFMAEEGADRFVAVYELFVNFHQYQVRKERKRRYPYGGRCPLELAKADLRVGVRTASWLDALEI